MIARGVPEDLFALGHGTRIEYSRGTWSFPRQIHDAWSALRAPEGRVHFAGAHTALHWPSFMDGAIESGHRVAAEVRGAR